MDPLSLTRTQQTALILLRTLIGWHFPVRTGAPLACGPERAFASARACIAGFEAIEQKARIGIEA
jgi:hypothetical protein